MKNKIKGLLQSDTLLKQDDWFVFGFRYTGNNVMPQPCNFKVKGVNVYSLFLGEKFEFRVKIDKRDMPINFEDYLKSVIFIAEQPQPSENLWQYAVKTFHSNPSLQKKRS